ncbi:MAG: hypothetical protein WCJ30_20025 [Deltaproteobacteria bacterium]
MVQPDAELRPAVPLTSTGDTRSSLVVALTAAIRGATACGDLAAARVALDALSQLVAEPTPVGPAAVADLAGRRRGER